MPSETGRMREKASPGERTSKCKGTSPLIQLLLPLQSAPQSSGSVLGAPRHTLGQQSFAPLYILCTQSRLFEDQACILLTSVSPEPGPANALMNEWTHGSGTSVFIPSVLRALSVHVHPDFQPPPVFAYLALGTWWVLKKCFLC